MGMTGQNTKSNYFNPDDKGKTVLRLIAETQSIRPSDTKDLHVEESAMLILDMQEFFILPESHAFVPSAAEIIPSIVRLAESFKSRSRPVILTRHTNTQENAGSMGEWWRDFIRPSSGKSRVVDEIRRLSDIVIEKHQYDAFYETNLDSMLRTNHVKKIVITGVMTHLCCETTARSGFMRGYDIFFPVDGTATYNEEHHRASLINLAHGFAHIVQMQDLLSKLQERSDEN